MRKIKNIFIIMLTAILILCSCNKDKNKDNKEYVENSEFILSDTASINQFTEKKIINLSNSKSVQSIDFENKLIIYYDSITGFDCLIDFDENIITSDEYIDIYKENGKYIFKNEFTSSVYEPSKGIIKTFNKGEIKILYNDFVAYFPANSYKIIIYNLKDGTSYEMYDKDKSLDKIKIDIHNYGKYLIYKNIEFSEFQIYNYQGKSVYRISYSSSFNNVVYIGKDNLFIYELIVKDNQISETNTLFNLVTLKETELNYESKDMIYNVLNEGNSEDINVSNGYSAFYTRNGLNFYADGNLEIKKEFYGSRINLIDEYAFTVIKDTSDYDTKTIIYNNKGEKINEFKAGMLYNSATINENIITYATLINNVLKYKAVTINNEPVISEDVYDYLSIFVDGVAIGKIGDIYYKVLRDGTKTALEQQNIVVLKGIYYYDNYIFKNYDGIRLINENPINMINFYNNNSGTYITFSYNDHQSINILK